VIGIIIQARMGSKRLPGKSMMDINGKPLLGHVIDNAREVLDEVIVATPDEVLADYAMSKGVRAFIGSEDDVLDRYYWAALCYGIDPIIRITADNPMVDPQMVWKLIKFYEEGDYDWASNCRLKVTYPVGNDAEIFSMRALVEARHSTVDSYDRESVTSFMYNHPELFKLGIMENDIDHSYLRWTVDTLEDLENVRLICR